ncbi:tyrosine-type recombinase/integrase [Streptomyces sp. NPDC059460]|uniref:tyrosine-type recombinase/integrase n=1 Tax=Streptomyces sp. NPDC059460 TaxID=3346840 RepID=UPI0036C0D6FA
MLKPAQAEAILDGCARFDARSGQWSGSVRYRLLFTTLSETGMRLGKCLSLKHCDWHVGRDGTPFVEVVPRQDHPAGVRVKNGRFRRIYISDDLERLHSEYVWELCDANAHRAVDLENFSHHLDLRDSRGELLLYSRSHRLRHTKATTLINAGSPIHVVQRYLGHLSPEMTMRYAAILASTAEREFLALAKIGRDGREVGMDRRDMLDLVQLDRRTDRILPNGYCLLPPTRSCDKGNACHGCDHFATDRTFLPDIQRQFAETQSLVATRQARHTERYGEPMSRTNVWMEQRNAEIRSMQLEIVALEAQPTDSTAVVRGAGVLGRTGHQDAANTSDSKGASHS